MDSSALFVRYSHSRYPARNSTEVQYAPRLLGVWLWCLGLGVSFLNGFHWALFGEWAMGILLPIRISEYVKALRSPSTASA